VTLFGGPRAQTLEQFAALVGAPRWAFTGTRAVTGIPGAVERVEALLTAGVPTDVVWVVGGCVGIDAIVARVGTARGAHVHCVLPAAREQVDPHWRDYCSTYEEVAAGATKADSYRKRNERLVAWVSRSPALAPLGHLDDDHDRPQGRRPDRHRPAAGGAAGVLIRAAVAPVSRRGV
jgi:hypothetical protein